MIRFPPIGATMKGIDVSHHNGNINWPLVYAWAIKDILPNGEIGAFAFMKAGEGESNVDPTFVKNYLGAIHAGFFASPYFFYRADKDPLKQAEHFINIVGPAKKGQLRWVMDWETEDGANQLKEKADAKIFLDRITLHTGVEPIIYTGPYFAQNLNLSPEFVKYPLWVAHYTKGGPMVPPPWAGLTKPWAFWQIREDGVVPGFTQHTTDINLFNGNLNDLKALLI